MKPFARSDRVGGQIKKALSDMLLKDINDPRLDNTIITGVKMSRDLRTAIIYFVKTGSKSNRKGVEEGFKSAFGYLKRKLARQLGLRYMPELKFYYDESFDYGEQIDKLLNSSMIENGTDS
jgi:ribosome-binding factor A